MCFAYMCGKHVTNICVRRTNYTVKYPPAVWQVCYRGVFGVWEKVRHSTQYLVILQCDKCSLEGHLVFGTGHRWDTLHNTVSTCCLTSVVWRRVWCLWKGMIHFTIPYPPAVWQVFYRGVFGVCAKVQHTSRCLILLQCGKCSTEGCLVFV